MKYLFFSAFMLGALAITYLLSRLLLWLTRSWDSGTLRVVVIHLLSWIITSIVYGFGAADGGSFAGIQGAMLYGPPQAVWLIVDIVRHRRRLRQSVNPGRISN